MKLAHSINIYKVVVILLFTVLVMPKESSSQQKDSTLIASIKGKVKDSTYNFMLTNATIAVYKDADSSLIQFALPNNFGEFSVASLPVGIPLRLIITHVGYKPFFRKFTLNREKKDANLGFLYMCQNSDEQGNILEEVVVKAIPPMRMNGDTLEFNADAFKMKPNATGEDWMRVLPGLTIWGDGEITFNGKKIQALMVDGKPFMGGSTTVATQNLPKDALQKLQIYQQYNEKNPLDSTMFANLKLKEDKKLGYFGKVSAGYGISPQNNKDINRNNSITPFSSDGQRDSPYAIDGMLSGFNKKVQLNVVGAINNINKSASSIDVLMKNSSYKGEGINTDYQSDFSVQGLNRPVAAGVKFQYDFIPDPGFFKRSRFNSDYFINDNQAFIDRNSISNNYVSDDTVLTNNSAGREKRFSTNQHVGAQYELSDSKMDISFNSSLFSNQSYNTGENVAEQRKTGVGLIANNESNSSDENRKRGINMGVNFGKRLRTGGKYPRLSNEFYLGYQFSANEEKCSSRTYSKYTYTLNPLNNREFARFYQQRDATGSVHQVTASYPRLKRLIFNRDLAGIEMGLSGVFYFKNNTYNNKVLDKDTITQAYVLNSYLTNNRNEHIKDMTPAFTLSKTFQRDLSNRYSKAVALTAELKKQFFFIEHDATQAAQNFERSYSRFIPRASAEYYNHQYGRFEMRYNLDYTTGVNYPGVNNIAPLVDSTNLWYIPKGNPFIEPEYKREISFKYSFNTRTPKNPLRVTINAGMGSVDNGITDSSFYNTEGVRTVYPVNVDGVRYFNGGIDIRKSVEMKKQQTIEVGGSYNLDRRRNPQYINEALVTSNNIYHSMSFVLSYRYKDIIILKGEENLSYYSSQQSGLSEGNNQFKSSNQFTRFSSSLQFPKNLFWATNISYNRNGSNNNAPVHYAIWNAAVTYRFLKGDRGEVKFSAMDLLRQNRAITNTVNGNAQTFSTNNVLQQYFMLTVAYYPRKFGK
ncbi:MAG: outer membrane beta-barrel protein [Niabella sp.]